MALVVNFWEADGPNGETLRQSIRVKVKDEVQGIMQDFHPERDFGGQVVHVTLDRTDRQSTVTRDLWVKPGYNPV